MAVLPDASARFLAVFAGHVEPGSTVSDGWSASPGAMADYYPPIVGKPHELPSVHRATALVKR